jgi:hypothetical protein
MRTTWLSGFRHRDRSPRGFDTVTEFQAFDNPDQALPAPRSRRTPSGALKSALRRSTTCTKPTGACARTAASAARLARDPGEEGYLLPPDTASAAEAAAPG